MLSCAYGPDGGRAASTASDGTVRVWARAAGPEAAKPGSGGAGRGCAWERTAHCDADARCALGARV